MVPKRLSGRSVGFTLQVPIDQLSISVNIGLLMNPSLEQHVLVVRKLVEAAACASR